MPCQLSGGLFLIYPFCFQLYSSIFDWLVSNYSIY
jgi:hypothetical protein